MSAARPNQARSAIHLGLPAGDAGIALTLHAMQQAALGREGAMNPTVREWALDATRDARDRDDLDQASAIFHAVRRAIRFRGEYSETVQTPLLTLQFGAGDCDDHATLIAALLRSIGIPARFKTVATNPNAPREFTHVYALAGLRQGNQVRQWLPMDTTVAWSQPGWEAPRIYRSQIWGGQAEEALGNLPEEQTQPQYPLRPLSQKASDISQLLNQGARNVAEVVSLFRNTGNTTQFGIDRTPTGYQASVGTSQTTLIVGGVLAAAVVAMAMLRRNY